MNNHLQLTDGSLVFAPSGEGKSFVQALDAGTKQPTNTERLIKCLEVACANGHATVNFMVGKYTGNGPSVVAALRARGFKVDRRPGGYVLHAKTAP